MVLLQPSREGGESRAGSRNAQPRQSAARGFLILRAALAAYATNQVRRAAPQCPSKKG